MQEKCDSYGVRLELLGGALTSAGIERQVFPNILLGKDPERDLSVMKKTGTRAVFIEDEEYPGLLREIPSAPLFLRVRGRIPASSERFIGIVGTRRASAYGRRTCRFFASEIASRGFTVVSGLARGIDTEAHRAALENNAAFEESGFSATPTGHCPGTMAYFNGIGSQGYFASFWTSTENGQYNAWHRTLLCSHSGV